MISSLPSPAFTPSRSISGKHHTENENPPLSPKRSFAQLEEDPSSQLQLKRRDVHPKRAPLGEQLRNFPAKIQARIAVTTRSAVCIGLGE